MTPDAFRTLLHNTFQQYPYHNGIAFLIAIEYLQDMIVRESANNTSDRPVFFTLCEIAKHLDDAHIGMEKLIPHEAAKEAAQGTLAKPEAPALQLLEKPETPEAEEATLTSPVTGAPIQTSAVTAETEDPS